MDSTTTKNVPKMISIITPVYNAENFLSLTCNSVLQQTWQKWELILVDDCSTDGSSDIMRNYAAQDDRVKCIYLNKNGGAARARNQGINVARGEFIAFLDADDLWAPQKLEKQLVAFGDRTSLGLVATNGSMFDSNGVSPRLMVQPERIQRGRISLADFILKGLPLATSSVMVKAECFSKCGVFKEIYTIGEDYELWMRIIQDFEVEFLDEKLIFYRKHDANTSRDMCKSRCCKIKIFENEILPNIGLLGDSRDEFFYKLQKMYTTGGKMLSKAGKKNQADVFFGKAIALGVSVPVTFRARFYRVWNRLF